MIINKALEQIGWGKYQEFLFINCLVVISS